MTQTLLHLKVANFDIVIPLYNAANRIQKLLDELLLLYESHPFRLILVDDFSTDDSFTVLKKIQANYPFEIEYIQLGSNLGQHNATMVGLRKVQGAFAITLDDDLQHPPLEVKKLIDYYEQHNSDLLYGAYINKEHSFFRNIGSYVLKTIVKLSNPKLVNITSFRLIKKEVIQVFNSLNRPIVFIDEYLINYASSVKIVQVQHQKRDEGKSSYSYRKLINFALSIILFHSSLPLKFITRVGLLMSLTFFGIGCYFILQKLFYDVQIGFTSIIVSIFFSSGLILFALGIIGEYIRKIWAHQNQLQSIVIRTHEVFKR